MCAAAVGCVLSLANTLYAGGFDADIYPASGPFAGGNIIVITNGSKAIGNGSDITNVTLGALSATTITGQGTNWVAFTAPQAVSTGMVSLTVWSASCGDLLAGTYTYNPAGAIGGTEYGPSAWTNVGSEMNSTVAALAHDGTNLYAGGIFTTAGGVSAARVAAWNGTSWTNLGSGQPYDVLSLLSLGTNLYSGYGSSTYRVGGVTTWNGTSWTTNLFGTTRQAMVYALAHDGTNLYAGGDFRVTVGDVPATNIAMWNRTTWGPVGSGINGSTGVRALTCFGGNLYAGGYFTNAGGVAVSGVAKWDGTTWTNTFAITNNGTEALALSGFGISDLRFEVSDFPSSVAVGGVSNFTVKFTPDAVGSFSAILTITNNSPTTSYIVNLAGSCFAASTNVGPFGGGNTITITNGYFGTITNVLLVGTPGSAPASLGPHGSNWFTITLPAATNAGSVDIIVQTSDNGDLLLRDAYTYNPAGAIGGSASTAILDNTSNGTAELTNSLGSITLNNWNAKVISTPAGEPTPLTGMKMSLYSTTINETNTFNLGLYDVDASHNPVGSALISTNVELNLTTNAAYNDIPLNAAQWTLQPGTNYALVFKGSTAGITMSWTIAGPPDYGNPYVATNGFVFLGGRRTTTGGSSWSDSAYNNGLQLFANLRTSGVSPEQGAWTGGYPVAITGTNLGNGVDITNVTLAGVSATISSQTTERVWVLAGIPTNGGVGDVVVQSVSFGVTTKTNAFTYLMPAFSLSGTGAVTYAVISGPGVITNAASLFANSGSGTIYVATACATYRYTPPRGASGTSG